MHGLRGLLVCDAVRKMHDDDDDDDAVKSQGLSLVQTLVQVVVS